MTPIQRPWRNLPMFLGRLSMTSGSDRKDFMAVTDKDFMGFDMVKVAGKEADHLLPDVNLEDTELLMLNKEDPRSWMLMPKVFAAIHDFCDKYDSDVDPVLLCRAIEIHFMAEKPLMMVLAVTSGVRLVGHLIASIEDWFGTRMVTVLQYRHEGVTLWGKKVIVTRDMLSEGSELLENWGRQHNAEHIQALVKDKRVIVAYKRFHHFKAHSVLMRRAIPKE